MTINTRSKIIEIGKKLAASQLIVGTWGNVSCRSIDENKVIITPSGVDYDRLEAADLPAVSLTSGEIEGKLKPSSELPLHVAIYRSRPEVNAIVHTHSTYGTCCAVLRQPIPPLVEDVAMVVGGTVEVAEYYLPGTEELAKATVKALGDKNAVLLANHGVVGVGHNIDEALKACLLTEKAAQIFITVMNVGQPFQLSSEDVHKMREVYLTSYGQKGGE
ncbi:MAG: class II aldolase/adducin family protein [Bacillota bacterium]|nr:class II aldolase/adducin family protein [Bacillota bacterium]